MHSDQATYRALYEDILDYDGGDLISDLLRPWLRERQQDRERRWLEALAKRKGSPVPVMSDEENWRLYALSRVIQQLQFDFVPAYVELMDFFGMRKIESRTFHPFTHEIVTVDEGAGEPVLIEESWPGYMLGDLVINRAGCRIAAGRDVIVKEIAEGSTMYWALVRPNRPAQDLSHGWGSNSQWRTEFRCDYEIGGVRYYNTFDVHPERIDDDFTPDERLELLRFRSFVRCAKPHESLFPYDYTDCEGS